MPSNLIKDLKDALNLGHSIVTRIWDYRARDWVTSVFAADIDGDGNIEVIACSRDGRVHLLSKDGDRRWERIIGAKAWVGTGVAGDFSADGTELAARIIVGTRDGKVFLLDRDGKTLTIDGQALPFGSDGRALDPKREQDACWCDTGYVIRQLAVASRHPNTILMGSEDRCAYGLDYITGKQRWKYQTNGWVRTVFASDVNHDGHDEILVGSVDRHLYMLNQQGQLIEKYYTTHPIHTIFAADVDQDGCIEILAATDGKDLVALNYSVDPLNPGTACFQEKWRRPFDNRLLSLCVTDIDGDGKMEIIAGSEDKHIYILDGQGHTIWRHNHKYRVFSIYPYDIDNDGLPELLVGSEHSRVRAMRIRLSRGIDTRIRAAYKRLYRSEPDRLAELTTDERTLLDDVIGLNSREFVTFKQAHEQMAAKDYGNALSTLLRLEQQKVERLWLKKTAYIRTVCLRHIPGEHAQEIIVGTSTGEIIAFNASGRRMWSTSLHDHIVDVQTGFIHRSRQEEIILCSSDHNVYIVSGPQKTKQRNVYIDNAWMSSICVTAPNRRSPAEIIIGSEDKKLYIYGSDLQTPIETIVTQEGVRIVRAHNSFQNHTLEFVVAGLGNRVYAYTRHGDCLWSYATQDHIRAIDIKDINGDGKFEVFIGSEDRNIHVLDHTGKLLWRYFLPHSVLSIDATDAGNRIFVGCANGFLYVFSREGDLQWSYQANDRIQAIRVEDVDDDGQPEIIIGAEDQLEVVRPVNQRKLYDLIEQCWNGLHEQQVSCIDLLQRATADPLLQACALHKLAEHNYCTIRNFDILEKFAHEGVLEVRKALTSVVMKLYQVHPQRARTLLHLLWSDNEQDVRDALIEHISLLIKHDWELGFHYLKHAASSPERFMQRMAIRVLHQQITVEGERQIDTRREAFRLLLAAAHDEKSEWIRQEAARTLAHLLNQDYGKLIVYIHLFIVKEIPEKIWWHIAHAISNTTARNYLNGVIALLFSLTEENALERLMYVVNTLEAVEMYVYGKDIRAIYSELINLFRIETIAGIANYQCTLNTGQFDANNKFARIVLDIFNKVSIVSRPLKVYLRRDSAQERLANLLEAIEAVDQLHSYIEQQYSLPLLGEPIAKLPDHHILLLLLEKWKRLVQTQLNELRGKAELKSELQTKDARNEEEVAIWLTVKNVGRGLASAVKITLLRDDDSRQFSVVGSNTFETEAILPQEETTAEFILKPHCSSLSLKFDIVYDDADNTLQFECFEDCLELRESSQEFHYIPNPYSTGTPTQDNKMFYGREKDMLFLEDNLKRDAKCVIVLYGQRRSGKTTVLLQLINTAILGEHIPVMIDLQRISYNIAVDILLHRMAYYIVQAMRKKNIVVGSTPELSSFKEDPLHTFDAFLDQIEGMLGERKLILLIDEFEVLEDQVTKNKLRPEIFEYLRDIVQHRPNINFLFAGTHKITEYTRWYRSAFFNIAIHHQLSKLNQAGAENLIQRPVEGFLEYEPLTVKKIRQLTADQPYLIHLMCRAIVDYCNERGKTFVTINDVNIVLQKVMQTGQFHFGWLWDQITPEERVALAAVAEGGKEEGRLLSFNEIEEVYHRYAIPHKRDYILDALKTLIEADVVEDRPGDARRNRLDSHKFRIPVGLTRNWLLKEHPLEVVRREMND